jgi:hypothetical protein
MSTPYLRTGRLLALLAGAGSLASAGATELVYKPVTPSFGR